MQTINPANGRKIRTYEPMTADQLEAAVQHAHRSSQDWGRATFRARAELVRQVASLLRRNARRYAELMGLEMGKPVSQGVREAHKCAWLCEHYAEHAETYLAPQPVETDAYESYVSFQPLGPVLAIMPWNFPFWQVFRVAAPALMAGNTVLLKHASNVTGCARELERMFLEAGFPSGLFTTLLAGAERMPDVIGHPHVAAVAFTGGTQAGRAVAGAAGQSLKKTVMELGGSDPYVILSDADVDTAASICARARIVNSGQSSIAAKRFIVVASQRAAFERRLVEEMRAVDMDEPQADADIGPLAREDLRNALHRQVMESVSAGARLALGGRVPERPGFWYPPTVLTDVKPDTPAYREELFGPVAAVIPALDDADAVRIANDSGFGLGAAVFTRNTARGRDLAEAGLEAGCCFVNERVRSDPRLPFGGVKQSGHGRALSSFGIRELVNVKAVYVA